MITFKSVGHFFAKFYKAIAGDVPAILATEPTVEAVTAKIPVYGPLALTIEDAGYAVLGELSALLNAGDAAVEAKLADAGLDIKVIDTVKAIVAGAPQIAAVAKSL